MAIYKINVCYKEKSEYKTHKVLEKDFTLKKFRFWINKYLNSFEFPYLNSSQL